MLIKEYRIVMPLSTKEYQIGQIYSTVKLSKNETGGGDGIEIVENEIFTNEPLKPGKRFSGIYTSKIYHLSKKAPKLLRIIVPKNYLKLHEESWNAYPYCKTQLTNPGFMGNGFFILIESLHLEGHTYVENALELPPEQLEHREVELIDIAQPVNASDYDESVDPTLFKSTKTGRGPLKPNWMDRHRPLMTCYKLVTLECKWWGLQNRIEQVIQNSERRLFSVFHRQVFCWMDEWYGLTLFEVQEMERNARLDLEIARHSGEVRGLQGGNSE